MANAVSVLYQKHGANFKTTAFKVSLSGNYAAPEVVTLTAATASNPGSQAVTGPNGNPPIPPRVVSATIAGGGNGYVGQLKPTATAGQFNLTLYQGNAAFAGAYTAGDNVLVEVDHDLQGF